MMETAEVVSSDLDDLILVNDQDENIGTMPKRECHLEEGVLHRAFSVFIFNRNGDVLLQQRSEQKMLWPNYWSNACCSHPRAGETSEEAAHRRVQQELGIDTDLTYLYKFKYQSQYKDVGSEHELCWVWVGFAEADEVKANTNEIAAWQFMSKQQLNDELDANPQLYTPWMKMEWQEILNNYQDAITV